MVNASRAPPFLDDPPVPFRSLFFLTTRRPPTSTLFPYTTLFRSHVGPAVVSIVAIEPLDLRPDRRFGSRELSPDGRSEEHTSELQSHSDLVCRLLLEKKKSTLRASPDRDADERPVEEPRHRN